VTDTRPDPDALLAKVQLDEAAAKRGRLKIFFGANAGVGKTFAMLAAAHATTLQGRPVRVGVVETHGRADTEAIARDLQRLALKEIEHRGQTLREFDLDAALAWGRDEPGGVRCWTSWRTAMHAARATPSAGRMPWSCVKRVSRSGRR
jgi:two-component system sensor histidine kinase KdpD